MSEANSNEKVDSGGNQFSDAPAQVPKELNPQDVGKNITKVLKAVVEGEPLEEQINKELLNTSPNAAKSQKDLEHLAELGLIEESDETKDEKSPSNKKNKELIPSELLVEAVALFGGPPRGMGVRMMQKSVQEGGKIDSSTPVVSLPKQLSSSEKSDGINSEEAAEPTFDVIYELPDSMMVDGVVFVALMTAIINEVATVLRALLAGESKFQGEALIAQIQVGLDSAEQRLEAGLTEALSLRVQAQSLIVQGVMSIVQGAVQMGAAVVTFAASRSMTQQTSTDANNKSIDSANAQLNKGREGPDVEFYDTNGNWNSNLNRSDYGNPPQKMDRSNIYKIDGANTTEISQMNNSIASQQQEVTQLGNQLSQGLSQVIGGIDKLLQADFKLQEARLKELSSVYQYFSDVLGTLSQVFEKMYSSSGDAKRNLLQWLGDLVRSLEQLAASANKFGGWDR